MIIQNYYKYPPLTGICKTAIENNMCYGCNKLEDIHFMGQATCEYIKENKQEINWKQEKMKI